MFKWIKRNKFDFYLAGPMRGYEDLNKPLFLATANLMRAEGYKVFNPAEFNDDDMDFEECMKIDLNAVINKCDKIAFLPKWKKSEGANAEALVAFVCGKEAFDVKLLKSQKELKLTPMSLAKYILPYGDRPSRTLTARPKRKKTV